MIQDFISQYAAWPVPLAEKFSALLVAELAMFLPAYQTSDNAFFTAWQRMQNAMTGTFIYNNVGPGYNSPPSQMNFDRPFLKPSSQQFTKNILLQLSFSAAGEFYVDPQARINEARPPMLGVTGNIAVKYDSRLFQTPEIAATRLIYGPNVLHYRSSTTYTFFARSTQGYLLKAEKMPYDGANTIYAMHENGLDIPGTDYALLKEFCTYINAYRKFGAQINAEARNAQQVAQDAIADYQEQLRDKIRQEQSALQNLSFSMAQASENEMRSAERDLTNLALNAQSLKINLENLMR